MTGKYPVITLCGSTRFRKAFEEANKQLTLAGYIVISVGLYGHAGDEEVWEGMDEGTLTRTKEMLDEMHKRKIDMADAIFVINQDGYIGSSTASEIAYAYRHGKKIFADSTISARRTHLRFARSAAGRTIRSSAGMRVLQAGPTSFH